MTERPAPFHIAPMIAVTDLERARAFYEGKLGLDGTPTPGGGWAVSADQGTVMNLLPDIPDAGSASWPVATIRVANVHDVVREFRSRGVPFLGPDDLPFDLDSDGVSHRTRRNERGLDERPGRLSVDDLLGRGPVVQIDSVPSA